MLRAHLRRKHRLKTFLPQKSWLWIVGSWGLTFGCSIGTEDLVPATVNDDQRLPELTLEIAGHSRSLHLETFGDRDNPVLLVFHGGGGSDYKAMLPLAELSDRYLVVMWDARGSGLSERVSHDEISFQSYADEIHAIKQHFSPDAPVSFVGYSFGGPHGAIWLSHYPEDIDQLVLIESGGLDSETWEIGAIPVPLGADWVHQFLWQNEFVTPGDHELLDYKLLSAAMPALEMMSCDPDHPSHYPMWRLGAQVYFDAHELLSDFDLRDEISSLSLDALLIATECGPSNADFQRKYIAPLFAQAEVIEIGEGADHLNLFDHATTQVLDALRGYLREYQGDAP